MLSSPRPKTQLTPPMPPKRSWLDIANECPPVFCRIVACTGTGRHCRPLTILELSKRSGLSVRTITWLSPLTNWNKLPAKTIVAFSEACGVDFLRAKKHRGYLRRGKLSHLNNTNPRQLICLLSFVKVFKKYAVQRNGGLTAVSVC